MKKIPEIIQLIEHPNAQITIIGGAKATISASMVECLVDFKTDDAKALLHDALNENRFVKLLTDQKRIKTLIITKDNRVYPSTFGIIAVSERVYKATSGLFETLDKTDD